MGDAFEAFCQKVMDADLFRTKRRNSAVTHAKRYLSGLVSQARRKNMEVMNARIEPSESPPEAQAETGDATTAETDVDPDKQQKKDYEAMQHFLSHSPWEESKVYDFVAEQADGRLGGRPDSVLIVDESAHSKKGRASVGVARQHNGRLGKQDNCQVGVHSVLNCGVHNALIGSKLFLPDEWVNDPERCKKAGVPEAEIKKRTKIELAKELIEQALEQEVRFACVAMDALYGRDSSLLEWLDEQALTYCAEVPANTQVFDQKPECEKRPKKIREETIRVDKLAEQVIEQQPATEVDLREGENGMIRVEVWVKKVWVWPKGRQSPRKSQLLIRRNSDGSLKLSLSNADMEQTSLSRLAQWQGARFFVEKTFQDGKSHVGMGQYQARGWLAWHHHMALVALALLFMTEQRMLLAESAPLLSAADVVELLDWHLAKKPTHAQSVAAIEARHRQRERNALAAQNRARDRLDLPPLKKMKPGYLPK